MILVLMTIIAISLLLAPMGCIMLWHRYNYFHDGFAHACLFSGVVGYFLGLPTIYSMMVVSILFSFLVFLLKTYTDKNSVVSVVSGAFLAASILFASKLQEKAIFDIMLFGDVFTIELQNLILIIIILILALILISKYFDKIVIISIDSDISKSNGTKTELIELVMLLFLALTIALSIRIVGAFLIGTLLITPAVTARLISRSPAQMVVIASIIAIMCGICGFNISLIYDWPLSPAIAITSITIYIIMNFIRSAKQ